MIKKNSYIYFANKETYRIAAIRICPIASLTVTATGSFTCVSRMIFVTYALAFGFTNSYTGSMLTALYILRLTKIKLTQRSK